MHKDAGLQLLKGMARLVADDGVVLVSTPCYDGRRMANNHIHEYAIDELQEHVGKAGLVVRERFGTFMDVAGLKRVAPEHRQAAVALGRYYGNDVVSCFLAPLYPDLCRNNIWVLVKKSKG